MTEQFYDWRKLLTYQQQPYHHDQKRFGKKELQRKPHIDSVQLKQGSQHPELLVYQSSFVTIRKAKAWKFHLNVLLIYAKSYINIDSALVKYLRRWMVSRNISVELVSVFVPLHRVKCFSVHIEVTL